MLPPADDRPQRRFPIVNATLIALNVAVYVGGFVFGLVVTRVLLHSGRISPSGRVTGWGAA